jgi:hypothetical protein
MTVAVNFVEARKHPAAPRVDAAIRGAPAWRAFPNIDPIVDLDWMTQHNDDMLVFHNAPDARVDTAIASIAQPIVVSAPNVKAWRGVVNGTDVVFLRPLPHYIRIARASDVATAVREVAVGPIAAPSFHANEALRARILEPSRQYPVPGDITEARIWIDSRANDTGADIYGEADCPSAAAAQVDAAAIAETIRRTNNIGVRIVTAGLLNNVEITPDGNKVRMHIHATEQQIQSVVSLAASQFGSP